MHKISHKCFLYILWVNLVMAHNNNQKVFPEEQGSVLARGWGDGCTSYICKKSGKLFKIKNHDIHLVDFSISKQVVIKNFVINIVMQI